MNTYLTLEGGILAGGQGIRLGGRDKGLLMDRQGSFIEHLSQVMKPHVIRLLVNANRHTSDYALWADCVCSDPLDDHSGPLRGLLTLMENCQGSHLIVSPCDTPGLPPDYVPRMRKVAEQQPEKCVIAHDGSRQQPLHLLLPTTTLLQESLSHSLNSGQRRVGTWVEQLQALPCDFSDYPEGFFNINTSKALNTWLNRP